MNALDAVLDCLADVPTRATYAAVEAVTGINRRRLGRPLAEAAERGKDTSLVVQSANGLPSPGADGYRCDETWWHPGLRDLPIIRDGDDLRQRVTDWLASD